MTPIIFDLDGTLIDVSARHYALYRSVISEQGVEALPPDDYWQHRRAGESTIDLLAATPGVDVGRFTEGWMAVIERPLASGLDVSAPAMGNSKGLRAGRGKPSLRPAFP